MKNLLAGLVLITLVISSCSKSDSLPQSDNQSRAHKGGGSTGGVDNSIAAVTGLSATVTGPSTVYLSWNSLSGATSYWVYRNNQVVAIMTSTNYTDSYASAGTYTYSVAPVVNSVLGPKSTSVTVTTQ
jgi:hypothetical protein